MIYISYEILITYLATAALALSSWLGLLAQVAHVAQASAEMRRHL